jgi:phospholipid transport system substrate-binding protein
VQYVGVDGAEDGTVVKTLAQNKVNKREKPLGINYVVSSTAAGFKVRDVVTDEVSLVGNYRTQFKRIIKKKGFSGLVEQMRKQLDK